MSAVSSPSARPPAVTALRWALVAAAILVAAMVFRNDSLQGINWTFPYFSGAANFETVYDWRISPSEYAKVKAMSTEEHMAYRYAATDDAVPNTFNNYGYVLVALAARTLLPWLGDAQAVVTLQVIVHVATSLLILSLLGGWVRRGVFFLAYAVNPLVLHIATYAMYYYWTVLPGVMLAAVWLRGGRAGWWSLPVALVLFLAFIIRPATLFVCLLVFAVLLWKDRGARVKVGAALVLFLALSIHAQGQVNTSPWHTVYIGIGAYENPYMPAKPLDGNGYALYKDVTGETVETNAISGLFNDPEKRTRYFRILRDRYLEIAAENPLLLVRNAAYNTLQAFGLGYDVSRPWVRPVSAALGLVMIGLIVVTRQWMWGLGLVAFAGAFTPYFPPVPAYLFGAYLFTALAAAGIADAGWRRLRGGAPATA